MFTFNYMDNVLIGLRRIKDINTRLYTEEAVVVKCQILNFSLTAFRCYGVVIAAIFMIKVKSIDMTDKEKIPHFGFFLSTIGYF